MPPRTPGIRVLMTADAVGGVWDYCLELASQLRLRGVETILAVMGPRPGDEQRRMAAEAGVVLEESDYLLEWMLGCEDDVCAAGAWLLGLEETYRPDLVHLNGYAHAPLPWKAPPLVVAHSCVLSWWNAVKGGAAPAEWTCYARRVRRALASAPCMVAPTMSLMEELRRHYGPLSRKRVIHNGRNPARYPPLPKEDFIFCAGRLWDEGKNMAALDAAAAEGLTWPVRAAGSLEHPCGGSIHPRALEPLGRLGPAQMALHFGKARIYALPARYEPFGLTPLEAALAGCALVLGDIPTLRELWQDAALFVDPEDHRGLHRSLQQLIANPARCRSLAARARERARSYTSARMAGAYLEVYRELLAGHVGVPDASISSADAVNLGSLG